MLKNSLSCPSPTDPKGRQINKTENSDKTQSSGCQV